MDITIKAPEGAQRIDAIKVFLRSFRQGSESSEKWLDRFTRMLVDAKLAHIIVACDGTTVVGCGALICFVETAWIALMGVEPRLQKQGIGNLLMTGIMEHAVHLGYRTVKLDATNFGRGLYSKHGFVAEYPVSMYEIPASCDCADSEGPRVRLDKELPEWCLVLDRKAVGDDRSALLRAVLADGGKVLMVEGEGFGILHGRKIGPIIASDLDAAMAIVRRADSFGVNRIYVPRHPELPEGFVANLKEVPPTWELTCCTRMVYGKGVRQDLSLEFAGYSAATG